MQVLGSYCICTTAYHPFANGMVERLHRQLKAAIKCLQSPHDWLSGLPGILLGIRTALKEDIGCTTQLNWCMVLLYGFLESLFPLILNEFQILFLMLYSCEQQCKQ
uniref:Integrase catalytic domain-containing protein n=1 Tax=Amphimedon queenslandica TaxID=400682 RepID=A0A1X7UCZ7_AMPQE